MGKIDLGTPVAERTRYEDDVYTWVGEQVALLRAGRFSEVDVSNVVEELSDVARSEFRSLVSALEILVLHLLKWDYQPNRRTRSWTLSIREQRVQVMDVLSDSPGLKSQVAEALTRGFIKGRIKALDETGLEDNEIPDDCPYTFDDVMGRVIAWLPASDQSN